MRPCFCLLTIFLFTFFTTSKVQAVTFYVPGDFDTIQEAIDNCVDGDTVLVAPDTYVENIDFLGLAITVKSESGPEVTIIDGSDPVNPDFGSVVSFQRGEGLGSILDGFTLTNGSGTFNPINGYYRGGGIICSESSPTILNNIVTGNSTDWGGGIQITYNSSPIITGNTIEGNNAVAGGGGGINCVLSSPTIKGNRISGNTATGEGGGIRIAESPLPTITNNTISGNSAIWGGGISVSLSSVSISGNIITNNGSEYGGGMDVWNAPATMNNNTIAENYAAQIGGGIACYDNSTVTINNTIFWNNSSPTGDEIWIGYYYSPPVPSTLTISYSDVEGGQDSAFVDEGCTLNWGDGMIDEDPLFMTYKGFDYLLGVGSPCIDTGDPSIEDGISDWHPRWPDWLPNGSRSDMGAYGGSGNKGWLAYREWGIPVDVNWRQLGFNAVRF
jgi:parallel beta-helix repeat protein